MLLNVGQLLEAAVAVGALVGFLPGVDPDVLHQLMVGGEGLEALLALVRLHLAAVRLPTVHLHRRLVHEDLMFPLEGEILHFRWRMNIFLHSIHGGDGVSLASHLSIVTRLKIKSYCGSFVAFFLNCYYVIR